MHNASRLLTTADVATRLGVARQTVARMCREGRLPCLEIGNRYRVEPNALEKFLTASTYTPPEFHRREVVSGDERIRIFEQVRASSIS